MPLIKIISVDMSYRDSGVCLISNDNGTPCIHNAFSIQNPAMDFGFESLRRMSSNVKSTIDLIKLECKEFNPDVLLLEMPFFCQNAKAAISIGLLWSSINDLDCILVEPSFIKIWSGSDPGDKKSKVKEKVKALTALRKDQLSNNNIVDSVAIGLAFCEMINN